MLERANNKRTQVQPSPQRDQASTYRDTLLASLTERTFHRQGNTPAVIFVAGYPGSGKTTIFEGNEKIPGIKTSLAHNQIGTFDLDAHINWEAERQSWGESECGPDFYNHVTKKALEIMLNENKQKDLVLWNGGITFSQLDRFCPELGIVQYTVLFLDCADEIRIQRFQKRGDTYRIDDEKGWQVCSWLREEARRRNFPIIDTGSPLKSPSDIVSKLACELLRISM